MLTKSILAIAASIAVVAIMNPMPVQADACSDAIRANDVLIEKHGRATMLRSLAAKNDGSPQDLREHCELEKSRVAFQKETIRRQIRIESLC